MRAPASRVDEVLREVRGPRVLDVGCASSHVRPESERWLHGRLIAAWDDTIGFDPWIDGVRRMREAGYRRVFVAAAEDFALSREFDTVVAGEVIEHLTDPAAFLTRARDHLAPGGRLVGTTPYPFSLLYFLYALTHFPRTCENPEHVGWFCPTTLEELARRCGLRLVGWRLVEDYKSGSRSRPYRWLVRFLRLAGRLVPLRLRGNAVLFVLERA